MKIIRRTIRKSKNREEYKVSLEYVTTNGTNRSVSFFAFSRREAISKLNFRLAGITNGSRVVKIG